ncbi:hypothetical protein L838_0452 [Mycobacterium avium MAV_120709_2344]|nr:hypothetical protein L838_0452 [Mycobacterium avium MAV_120709_2344]
MAQCDELGDRLLLSTGLRPHIVSSMEKSVSSTSPGSSM